MEKTAKKSRKVWSVLGNIFIWIFIAFSVLMTVLAFAAQSSPDGVPTIGNTVILVVQSPSMQPTFNVGDIIIGKKVPEEAKTDLKVDEIITFVTDDLDGDGKRDLNTHRIIEIVPADNGSVTYVTKGDNNAIEDARHVNTVDIVCRWEGTRIKGLGKALNFLQSPTGFLVTIVIPLLLFFVLEIVLFVRKVNEVRNQGKKQITAADEELIKQRAIEEYLRLQKEAEEAAEPAAEAPAEAPAEEPAPAEETDAEAPEEA
ncbi:MAG: signal peptidase I [Clostridia bacterium]|nr:signal peptidase I [Clostridia bacterium]